MISITFRILANYHKHTNSAPREENIRKASPATSGSDPCSTTLAAVSTAPRSLKDRKLDASDRTYQFASPQWIRPQARYLPDTSDRESFAPSGSPCPRLFHLPPNSHHNGGLWSKPGGPISHIGFVSLGPTSLRHASLLRRHAVSHLSHGEFPAPPIYYVHTGC